MFTEKSVSVATEVLISTDSEVTVLSDGSVSVITVSVFQYFHQHCTSLVLVQYFSVNFHFLNNNKSYSRDFFTIDTIGYGLSFDGIEGTFPLKFFRSSVHTIFRKCLYICIRTYEGTTRGDTFLFDSFISHSGDYIEVVKSLKGFLPNVLPSKVMVVLLNSRPIPMYLPKK